MVINLAKVRKTDGRWIEQLCGEREKFFFFLRKNNKHGM